MPRTKTSPTAGPGHRTPPLGPLLRTGWMALLGAGLLVPPAGATEGLPPPGRHAAQLCVGPLDNGARVPDCGPADAQVQRGNRLQLRISDIVYRFELHSSQVDVVLMHGSMQIDGFTAPYDWEGATLRFDDIEKHTRYQVRFLGPARASR